jgi:FMN phosphatase YigB (HAD superfamily)
MNVIFDVGRVLCNVNLSTFIKEFDKLIGPKINFRLNGMDFLSSIQCLQDSGHTTVYDSLLDLNRRIDDSTIWQPEIREVTNAWKNTVTPYKQMIEFKSWCLQNNHSVAILSNMGHEHKAYILSKYPEVFDGCKTFFSCDLGYRKPSSLFFYLFLNQFPSFKKSLYLDDLHENLGTGDEMGLKGYHINLEEIYLHARNPEDMIKQHIITIKNILNINS